MSNTEVNQPATFTSLTFQVEALVEALIGKDAPFLLITVDGDSLRVSNSFNLSVVQDVLDQVAKVLDIPTGTVTGRTH